MSNQESTQEEKLIAEFMGRMATVSEMANGRRDTADCVQCGQLLTKLDQVGRSVYGRPCNHRQYQGRLPKR